MYYHDKVKTWKDNWNDVIRYVLYKDNTLKELMCLPEKCTITQFVDKFFIEDANGSEQLKNEKVRIVVYDSEGVSTGNQSVAGRLKEFDIYVKDDVLRTASDDRLQKRTDLITERIKYLLLKDRYVCNIRFRFEADYDLWTKTTGYKRHHVVFSYKTTV